jgi:hypothetical protein
MRERLVIIVVHQCLERQKEYKIQRDLLVNASVSFQKAPTRSWKEAAESRLALDDTEIEAIEQFLYFLIRGEVRLPLRSAQNELLPVRLWVFTVKHFLPKLQNLIMRHLYSSHSPSVVDSAYPQIQTITEELNTSVPDSALYKFMMWVLVTGLRDGSLYEYDMGQDTSDEILLLERLPGVLTDVLKKVMLYDHMNRTRGVELKELLVKET